MSLEQYKELGKVNFAGTYNFHSSILVSTLILVYEFICVTFIPPIVYLNSLLSVGFGIAIMYLNKLLNRLTQNRSRQKCVIRVLASVLLADIFQWIVFVFYVKNGSLSGFGQYLVSIPRLILPENLFPIISSISEIGVWSINNIDYNGSLLVFVWITEILIISGIQVLALLKSRPCTFSESLGKLDHKFILRNDLISCVIRVIFVRFERDKPVRVLSQKGKGVGLTCKRLFVFSERCKDLVFKRRKCLC